MYACILCIVGLAGCTQEAYLSRPISGGGSAFEARTQRFKEMKEELTKSMQEVKEKGKASETAAAEREALEKELAAKTNDMTKEAQGITSIRHAEGYCVALGRGGAPTPNGY